MSDSPDRPSASLYRCRDCGSESGFRSRRRTLTERLILPLLLLQPVRCGECFRRDYRLIFTPVRQRLSDDPGMMPGKQSPGNLAPAKPVSGKSADTSNRNVA
jgi:hypothetical protein